MTEALSRIIHEGYRKLFPMWPLYSYWEGGWRYTKDSTAEKFLGVHYYIDDLWCLSHHYFLNNSLLGVHTVHCTMQCRQYYKHQCCIFTKKILKKNFYIKYGREISLKERNMILLIYRQKCRCNDNTSTQLCLFGSAWEKEVLPKH